MQSFVYLAKAIQQILKAKDDGRIRVLWMIDNFNYPTGFGTSTTFHQSIPPTYVGVAPPISNLVYLQTSR